MGGVISQIGLQRLDWFGFGVSSANRTGAFIACLIVAIWILFSFRLKWLSALAWIASIVLFYFLVQTASRGAIISLVCAGIFFLYFSGLKFEKYGTLCFALVYLCDIFLLSKQVAQSNGRNVGFPKLVCKLPNGYLYFGLENVN